MREIKEIVGGAKYAQKSNVFSFGFRVPGRGGNCMVQGSF